MHARSRANGMLQKNFCAWPHDYYRSKMSKNTFSTIPLSSALTVRRRQDADDSVTAAHAAMERMVLAGIQSGASFTATVKVSGASLSASFNLQDSQRPSHRPHTARAAAPATPAPAVHQLHVQPMSTARTTTSSSAACSKPPCRFFAAGFCNRGQSCTFGHGVAHQAPRPLHAAQPSAHPAVMPSGTTTAPQAAQHRQRPSSSRAAGGGLAADSLQRANVPVSFRPSPPAKPPREMQCLICMENGVSNQGVVCSKGDHFTHRACLDQWITHSCNEYLTHGPCKPSVISCPHNSKKCCVYTSNQLRREGGGASASCIQLLDRVDAAEAALQKLPRAEQLRRANQDAYMCPQCNFGPVAHYACPDVSWQGNRCPKCSYHTDNISGWRKWDGNFAVSV